MSINIARPVKKGHLLAYVAQTLRVHTINPWYRKTEYTRVAPPWSKVWGGSAAQAAIDARPALKAAMTAFTRVASETVGIERWQRKGIIARALKGKSYGGMPKRVAGRKISPSEAESLISRFR